MGHCDDVKCRSVTNVTIVVASESVVHRAAATEKQSVFAWLRFHHGAYLRDTSVCQGSDVRLKTWPCRCSSYNVSKDFMLTTLLSKKEVCRYLAFPMCEVALRSAGAMISGNYVLFGMLSFCIVLFAFFQHETERREQYPLRGTRVA